MNRKNIFGIFLITGLVIVAAAFFLFQWQNSRSAPSLIPGLERVRDVRESNSAFKQGLVYFQRSDYKNATEFFIKALEDSQNISGEAYIRLHIGLSQAYGKDYRAGIETLKSVANNENYADAYRASAIEAMGNFFYLSGKDPLLTSLIFSTAPYSSILGDGKKDTEKLYADLYRYAVTFSSVPAAEYRIALSMAAPSFTKEGFRCSAAEGGTEALKVQLKKAIAANAAQTEFLQQIDGNPLAIALRGVFRGDSFKMLTLCGENHATEAEESFKKALDGLKGKESLFSSEHIWASYHYALFLSELYKNERKSEISTLLSLFSDPSYKDTILFSYLAKKESRSDKQISYEVNLLSGADTRFAESMRSLGWDL